MLLRNTRFSASARPARSIALRQREHQRHPHDEDEQRENQVIEVETGPLGVFELVGQKARAPRMAHAVERIHQRIRADDPEHIEPAQRVHGHQPLTGCSVFPGSCFSRCGHKQLSSRHVYAKLPRGSRLKPIPPMEAHCLLTPGALPCPSRTAPVALASRSAGAPIWTVQPSGAVLSTGPRSIERGRAAKLRPRILRCGRLQRGRAQLSAEGPDFAVIAISHPPLQRGRAQLSAEGRVRRPGRSHRQASTGPRSIERGRRAATKATAVDNRRFNGAALN